MVVRTMHLIHMYLCGTFRQADDASRTLANSFFFILAGCRGSLRMVPGRGKFRRAYPAAAPLSFSCSRPPGLLARARAGLGCPMGGGLWLSASAGARLARMWWVCAHADGSWTGQPCPSARAHGPCTGVCKFMCCGVRLMDGM